MQADLPPADVRTTDQAAVVNIAAYRFAPLDRLDERREELRSLCKAHGLKGTILLSPEGINLFIAGSRDGIDTLVDHLRQDPLLADIDVKESFSDRQPFSRMLVKIKQEIIAFGVDGIEPHRRSSPKLSPQELKAWLDEGRPVTLLDTRNEYEIALGTFDGAVSLGIDHFRNFPQAIEQMPAEAKERPIVMFCTGGIRCEKAGPFVQREGFPDVYQLEGGILRYFEECGDAHYHGDCFVFDHRVAVDAQLRETKAVVCPACLSPLSEADQQSPQYEPGKHCPHCFEAKSVPQQTEPSLSELNTRIAEIASPLPGSVPYTNERPLTVPGRFNGLPLIEFLTAYHPHVGRDEWQRIIDEDLIRDTALWCRSPDLHRRAQPDPAQLAPTQPDPPQPHALTADTIVRGGQTLIRLEPDTVEPDVNAAVSVIQWRPDFVAIDKPAPLPMHPCGRFNRNTLSHLLEQAFPDENLRPVHRLDANTSGVVLLARTKDAARSLQRQFEEGRAKKTYLCRVFGRPQWAETTCRAPISAAPAEHGHRVVDPAGRNAETSFRVVETSNDASLIEATPLTGRTNQIRVHLWHLGHPIVGDPAYLRDNRLGTTQTLSPSDEPLCLHASRLVIAGSDSRKVFTIAAASPEWLHLRPHGVDQ